MRTMSKKDVAIIFDCGATNVRVLAIDSLGMQIAASSLSNEHDEDPYYPGGRIWDLDKLWRKLAFEASHITTEIDCTRIVGTIVNTFGVYGAFVAARGISPLLSS